MCIGYHTPTRDKSISQHISGCKPYFLSQFCKIELSLKFTS